MSRRIKRPMLRTEMVASNTKSRTSHLAVANGEIPNDAEAITHYETFYSDRAKMIGRILSGEGVHPDKETPDLKVLHEMLDEQGGYSYHPNGAQSVLQSLIYTNEFVNITPISDVLNVYELSTECKQLDEDISSAGSYETAYLSGVRSVYQSAIDGEYTRDDMTGNLDRAKLASALEDTCARLSGQKTALESLIDGKYCHSDSDDSDMDWYPDSDRYIIRVSEDRFVESLPHLEELFDRTSDGTNIEFRLYPDEGEPIYAMAVTDKSQKQGSRIQLTFTEDTQINNNRMDLNDALVDLSSDADLQL